MHLGDTMKLSNILLLIALLALTAIPIFASHSVEQIVVRVTNYNPSTRQYTFTCQIPAGAGQSRYWTIRPDTPALEASFYTNTESMTYTLTKDVMYHIGCQVQLNGQNIRGDFHI